MPYINKKMNVLEENLLEKKFRDNSLKLHVKRLHDIKTRGSHRIDNSYPRTREIVTPQQQGKKFLRKESFKGIIKGNQKFYEILKEVSAGKRETITQRILHSINYEPSRKTLNSSVRKRKETEINEENEAMFKRIENASTVFSVNKFNKEWDITSKYKSTITRRTPRYGSSDFVQTCYLPPLLNTLKLDRSSSKGYESSIEENKNKFTITNCFPKKKINQGIRSSKNTQKNKTFKELNNQKDKIEDSSLNIINKTKRFISDVIDDHHKRISDKNINLDDILYKRSFERAKKDVKMIKDIEKIKNKDIEKAKRNTKHEHKKKNATKDIEYDKNPKEIDIKDNSKLPELNEEGINLKKE